MYGFLFPMRSPLAAIRHHRARTRFIRAMLEAHDQPSRLDRADKSDPHPKVEVAGPVVGAGCSQSNWSRPHSEAGAAGARPDVLGTGLACSDIPKDDGNSMLADVRAASVRLQAMVDNVPRIPEQTTRSGESQP
jgi:hypothetical protein